MVKFRAVQVQQLRLFNGGGWAVERAEPDGLAIVVSRVYSTRYDAELEAERLNEQNCFRLMG